MRNTFQRIAQDLRYALRIIRKNIVFCAVVIVVLGLAIGANTAVFSIVHEILLKPLPFRDAGKLVAVWDTYLPQFSKIGISPAELGAWQAQHDLFDETAWYRYVPLDGNLALPSSEPVVVHVDFVSANFFAMLGTPPELGRGFAQAEDPHSALLSSRLWQSHFHSDAKIVGSAIHLNDELFTVIGVMPPQAQFPAWADLWLPQGPLLGDQLNNPVRHALGFIGRLRSGVTQREADARLHAISQPLAREHPATSTGWGIRANSLQQDLSGDVRPALLLLLGAASLLLLIACANIASLLLSKASTRAKEMAIRAAIGASSVRIVQQLVTENLVLALLGGALGWMLAKSALFLTLRARTPLEPTVLLFLVATSIATGIFFGLAPAIHSLRVNPQPVMQSAATTSSGGKTRSALVVFELGLTLMLVIAAAILAKSFLRLMQVNPGFNPAGVLTMRILALPSQEPEPLFHRVQDKLLSISGVEAVAVTNALPLMADRANTSRFKVPGSPLIDPNALPTAQIRTVSPFYFRAMNIALRAGRVFTEHDLNQPAVMINETMAKRFWPGRDPVGIKFITGPWGPNPSWSTIVGVVADVKQFGLDSEPSFDVYFPSLSGQYLILKTDRDLRPFAPSIERTLHSIDPELAISEIRSMDQIAAESARTRRWTMALLAAFASLAFLLALVGIYGVMSWSVAQRRREVGIRMALGAERKQVLALILRHGARLAVTGVTFGILASALLRHALQSLVYGISTGDPWIYGTVAGLMFLVALLACYVPARKAAALDPAISLRHD